MSYLFWEFFLFLGGVSRKSKNLWEWVFLYGRWTTTLGKILTLNNLRKRRVIMVGWCCICKRSEEFIDHLLLQCKVAWNLWSAFFTLFDVTWVMPEMMIDLLACWRGQVGTRSVLAMWIIAPLYLMWTIWRERNARCFDSWRSWKVEGQAQEHFGQIPLSLDRGF
jgi:hypothetical protein